MCLHGRGCDQGLYGFFKKLFFAKIKIVFNRNEAQIFVNDEKVPVLFNYDEENGPESSKRLFEKIKEVHRTYCKMCLVRPIVCFDITHFAGDKEIIRKELVDPLKSYGVVEVTTVEGGKNMILFNALR